MARTRTVTAVDPFSGAAVGPARRVPAPPAARQFLAPPPDPAVADLEDVPDGDEQAVLGWVGHDVERAMAALVAEHSRGHGQVRTELIAALNRRIGP